MAIRWAVNEKGRNQTKRLDDNVVRINYIYGDKDKSRFTFSISSNTAKRFSKTDYVQIGYDKDTNLFFIKESLSRGGFKIYYPANKANDRRYVRIPLSKLGITAAEAESFEGDYTIKGYNTALWSLKKRGDING